LVGPTRAKSRNENFIMGILSDKHFAQFEELAEELPIFADLMMSMNNTPEEWKRLISKEDLQDSDLLQMDNLQKMSTIQRLIFMRVIRPDRMIHSIRKSIQDFLSPEFLDFPQSNLQSSFLDSSPQTPLILVLSPGSDPLKDIKKLAKDMAKGIVVKILSLGQGQEKNANNFIQYAMEKGEWVVLQNCHLSYKYLPTIEKLLESEESHEDFRLWLTSIPSERFPVTILQNGIKITNEPPQGLRANTLKNFNTLNARDFEDHTHPEKWKKLLYSVILFHSVIQERRKYSSLGWNIPYEFSQNDLIISMTQLNSFLSDYSEVPWKGLQTCIGDLNYGGRVTDIMDTRLIRVILKQYLNPEVLQDSYKFSECGSYMAKGDQSLEDFKQLIKSTFPLEDAPTIFGLHSNANIVVGIKESNNLLENTLKLLPRESSQQGGANDQRMIETCENILNRIPTLFNLETVKLSYPIQYDNSMNTVLQQELLRYNTLSKVMTQTLKQVIQAVKGLIVMSTELEQILDNIYDNKVPSAWKKYSYPSLKPLSSWFEDFLKRIQFMQSWIDLGHPKSYWISGFFFTQSFLTGTKQDFSRKKKIPIGKRNDFI
jgi:dynein heavy chain